MEFIAQNIKAVEYRIRNACERAGRNPADITLVAVTKTFPAEYILKAAEYGITDVGENRVQEAVKKYALVGNRVRWHLIGHLQTNKVKRALEFSCIIHSVDSVHLAEEISIRAQETGKSVDILAEVNTSGEESKFGVKPEETVSFVKSISRFPNVVIKGLMTIGIFSDDPEDSRKCFKILRELKNELTGYDLGSGEMKYLSMGMSNDYEIAIEEGADIIRVGTAIFGQR